MKLISSIFFACIYVFPVHLIFMLISGGKKRQERAREKAISRGHVVTAYLKRTSLNIRPNFGDHRGWVKVGWYKYEYKGKKYTYRYFAENPPESLTLYFVKNPRKAAVGAAVTDTGVNWPLVYIAVALILYLIKSSV